MKTESRVKLWKLKREECCREVLGGREDLSGNWESTGIVLRETVKKVFGVSSGQKKEDKKAWWWNEEVKYSNTEISKEKVG